MAKYDWGTNKWDLIVLSYAGGRDYAARVKKALKPGGRVVLEAFHMDATEKLQVVGGDYRVFFKTDELKKLYGDAGLKIVRYEEPIGTADFTKQQLRLVKMVAQKPVAVQLRIQNKASRNRLQEALFLWDDSHLAASGTYQEIIYRPFYGPSRRVVSRRRHFYLP